MQYIIIQPWFIDPGHPAQSLVRTYRSTKSRISISSLIYVPAKFSLPHHLQEYSQECQSNAVSCPPIFQFLLGTLATGTFITVKRIYKYIKKNMTFLFFS
jgi:hypothetical protein